MQKGRLYSTHSFTNSTLGTRIQHKDELLMHNVMESCVFKSVMSFVVGGALGGKFIYIFIIFSIFFKKFQIFIFIFQVSLDFFHPPFLHNILHTKWALEKLWEIWEQPLVVVRKTLQWLAWCKYLKLKSWI